MNAWLELLGEDDMLVLTADHGCDVTSPHTEHTREHAPLLAAFRGQRSRRHDGPLADVGASALDWLTARRPPTCPAGRSLRSGRCSGPARTTVDGVPELPEVETIRRQLAPHLEGRTIVSVEILDPRWTRPDDPAGVEAGLRGAHVEQVGRHGKYLDLSLSGDRHLLPHLRMTGALLHDPAAEPIHTRVRIELDDGHRLVYVDPRRFGTGHLTETPPGVTRTWPPGSASSRSPLSSPPSTSQLGRGRRLPVKAFVLDQRRIAGVGNIYADEALFRARIHPLRSTGRLTRAQWAALRDAIEDALAAGIDAKGASIDDFQHLDGARGSFQDRFLVHTRAGEPCPRCGRPVRSSSSAGAERTSASTASRGRGSVLRRDAAERDRAAAERQLRASRSRAEGQPIAIGHIPALGVSGKLNRVAQRWTNSMIAHGQFSHARFIVRLDAVHYDWQVAEENIATGYLTPSQTVTAWMASPDHCRNILDPAVSGTSAPERHQLPSAAGRRDRRPGPRISAWR